MKTKRRLLGLLLCSAVLFSLCTPPAFAETQAAPAGDGISVQAGNEDVGYIDADGNPQSATATVVESNMTNWGMDTYVVKSNVTINSRVSIGGEAYLILADGCELTVSEGIIVDPGSSLIIYAQSTGEQMGTLKATATSPNNAGIGGTGGIIVINGGKVEATGSDGGAGIGCGYIEINGGMVTATGNDGGAGIGGGRGGTGGNILISGGTVEANGKNGGAGIGGGDQGAGGRITIRGGTVTATGGDYGAGIGGGNGSGWGSGGHVTIRGGTVVAAGGNNAAGIGGGLGSAGGSITISGGTVTANGDRSGAGIGGSDSCSGGNITISGGTVTANGGNSGGAGIGGGYRGGSDSSITIRGGMVTANGNIGGAGIGGGRRGPGGDITISGGTVTANGKDGGAGIGGGFGAANSGTFSTPNGSAVIFATDILGGSVTEDDKADWRGMIFEGDNGAVYGSDFTLFADTEIPSGKTLTIEAGKTLTIEADVTLTNNGTIDCAGKFIVDGSLSGNKAIQAAPTAPVVKNATIHSVELEAVAANSNTGATAEYSMDNGVNWQDSPVFTGLKPNTEYTFVVRYKGADPFFAASPPSNATTVTTGSEQHNISVSAEPAEGGTASASLTSAKQGEEITLTATQSRGWHFKEWQVVSGGVTIRDNKFIMPAGNVSVKAVFEKDSGSSSGGSGSGGGNSSGSSSGSSGSSTTNYTLTFESNGGSAIEKVTETSGKVIDLSGYRPTREGYDFNGWYLDKELTRKITEIRLDGNKTVYAGWTEHKADSGISTPDSNRKSPPTGDHGARLGRQTQKPQIWRERAISKEQKKGIPV